MNHFLDTCPLPCPQPVREAKRILKTLQASEVLTVWCKDEMTLLDFKGFCSVAGYQLIEINKYDKFIEIKIRV